MTLHWIGYALLIGNLTVGLIGCGNDKDHPENEFSEAAPYPGSPAHIAAIHLTDGFTPTEKDIVTHDLKFLSTIWIDHGASRKMQRVMKISDPTPLSLVHWLEERVQFMIAENISIEASTHYADHFVNQASGPRIPNHPDKPDTSPKVYTVMANVGTGIYDKSRNKKQKATVSLPGIGDVVVTSPRTGLIQVGEGYFISLLGRGHLKDVPHTMSRIGTLFHEARHSDGNGLSRGFGHAVCPSGTYAQKYACDDNLNGPYTIERLLIKGFAETCKSCKPGTIDTLKLLQVDLKSRIIRRSPGVKEWDDTPEGKR